jgi:hypothetical protein
MGHVYIQTNKFYTIPAYEDYHLAKNAYLQAMNSQYNAKQTEAKWAIIINQLINSLNQQHMPNGEQIAVFQQRLTAFKTTREGTSVSLFNLSLTQCVNYFEEFTFLYNTTDPRYKLTDAAKIDLLKSINEAMGLCETGLNGRLYTALQAHQKENDWIQNELVKARCETLRMLHNQFGSQDVHTYNMLVQMANKAQLGIPKKEEILDIHESMVDSAKLEAYFNKNYPALFATYEKEIKDNLTNHYLSELATTLGVDSADWAAGTVTLPFVKTTDISGSITAYFQDLDPNNDILYQMGDLSANYKEYILKSQRDVAKIIKDLVAEKLIADKYLVTLDNIAENRRAYTDLRLKKGVVLDELIKLHQALKLEDAQQVQDKLQQNPRILMSYPDLVISQIQDNPRILSSVPRWLKADTRFVDSSMVILNQLLCDAISENNEDKICNLTTQVLNLIQSEYGYVQQLSNPVLNNQRVAAMLVEKNSLLFGYLDESLQNNQQFQPHVSLQEPLGVYADHTITTRSDMIRAAYVIAHTNHLPNEYKNEPGLAALEANTPSHQLTANFLRIKAFIALLKPGAITQCELFAHVNHLNPALLLKVISYRKTKNLPPLRFFDNDKTYKNLNNFNLELTTGLAPDWSQDYLSIKRRACEQENFAFIGNPYALKNAVTFLSKTDNWFAGFNQYHVYQSSNERLWARLAEMMHALLLVTIFIIKIGVSVAILWYVIPVLEPIITLYFWEGLLTFLSLSLWNVFLKSPILATVNDIIGNVIFLDGDLFLAANWTIFLQSVYIIVALAGALDGVSAVLEVIYNAFSYFTSKHIAETLEDTCENTVIRLDGINEASAQGKGELLRGLLTQVKAEINAEQVHSFKKLLDKKYPITYQGREHNVSFSEVASKRRAHYGEFKLNDQPDRMCFFSGRTTTGALLAAVEPSLGMN